MREDAVTVRTGRAVEHGAPTRMADADRESLRPRAPERQAHSMWTKIFWLSVVGATLVAVGVHTVWTRGAHLDRVALYLRNPVVRMIAGVIVGLWAVGLGAAFLMQAFLEATR